MLSRVLVAAVERVLAEWPDAPQWLTEDERARAAGFRFARDRDAFVAAHTLVRASAAAPRGAAPHELTLEQECPTCGGAHGPPRLRELPHVAVSLSHSEGYVAVAAGPGPLGVDIERPDRLDPTDADRIAGLRLASGEARFVAASTDPAVALLELWVRKEAIVKARRGTLDSFLATDLVGDSGDIPSVWQDLQLTVWHGPDGVIGACAARAPSTVARWPSQGRATGVRRRPKNSTSA